jgi:O-antigen/teichoic acid export membrane protein
MRHLPRRVRASTPAFETRHWVAAIIPLTLTDALLIVNLQADLLVLGLFRDAADVGIYRAAVLVASQVTIGLTVANEVLAPHVARLQQAGDRQGLQSLVRQAQGWLALSGLVLAGICVLADREILTFVFGPAYAGGASALAVLAAGQFISVVAGANAVLLNMSGNERDVLRVFAVSAAVNLAANFALVPSFGLMGAAIATAGCQLVTNALLLHYVRRRLGLTMLPRVLASLSGR